jgi:hypothetical protein
VPAAGSVLTTVQFCGARTMVYFGVAEASVTLLSPRASSLSSAIFAFCPVKSGIVIEDAVAIGVHRVNASGLPPGQAACHGSAPLPVPGR